MGQVVTEPRGADVWDPSLGVSANGCSQCTGGGGEVGEKETLGHATVGSWPRPTQITGIWYVKAMVADKLLKNRPKKLSPVTMTPLDNGDLESSYTAM